MEMEPRDVRVYTGCMKQILIIHGGESYASYDAYLTDLKTQPIDYERLKPSKRWRDWLAEELPSTDYDILTPTFPNGSNAQFDEWAIYFEKLLPFLHDDTVLIGHSLGAMFLAKYLHDHTLPFRAKQIVLIAGRHGSDEFDHGGSFIVNDASGLENSCDEVHLFHSQDDPIVEFASLALFKHDIPNAVVHQFTDRRHFNEPTFPELLDLLRQD